MSNFFCVSLLITLYMNEPRYKLKCFYHWSFSCMLNCCPHKSYFHNTKLVLTLDVEPCKGQIFFFIQSSKYFSVMNMLLLNHFMSNTVTLHVKYNFSVFFESWIPNVLWTFVTNHFSLEKLTSYKPTHCSWEHWSEDSNYL